MNPRELGKFFGRMTRSVQNVWENNWKFTRGLLTAAMIVLLVPPVEHYWMSRVPRFPEIPLSVIVFTVAAGFFMVALGAVIYVAFAFLKEIGSSPVSPSRKRSSSSMLLGPSDGSFNSGTDEAMWQVEELANMKKMGIQTDQIDLLRKNGVLTESDREMMNDIARTALLNRVGRTE